MGEEIVRQAIAGARGLEYDLARDIHLPPGTF
jgi:hypothetical protein